MAVKRQWKVLRLMELPIREDVRKRLIHEIISRKNPKISVYTWKISEGTAPEVFFTQRDALKDWYLSQRVWEEADARSGTLIYEWQIDASTLVRHSKKGRIQNVPVPESHDVDVAVMPSSLKKDIQQTLQKQG